MTETELIEKIAALEATSDQIQCRGSRGRSYRRKLRSRKGDRILRINNHGNYLSPFRTRGISDLFDGYTLLHSSIYVKYNKIVIENNF